jgi:archaellum component FlaC
VTAFTRWNDDRIDDVERRLRVVEGTVPQLAILSERVGGVRADVSDLHQAIRAVEKAVQAVPAKIAAAREELERETESRRRYTRNLAIAFASPILAAIVGSAVALLGHVL